MTPRRTKQYAETRGRVYSISVYILNLVGPGARFWSELTQVLVRVLVQMTFDYRVENQISGHWLSRPFGLEPVLNFSAIDSTN